MTVVARRIAATPARSASEAWHVLVNLVAPSDGAARKELQGIEGIASCVIAEEAMKSVMMAVVLCVTAWPVFAHGRRLR